MSYLVQLETFEGPLDLLLHLVKQEKMDIWDIDISLIADRFLAYLNQMQTLDIEVAGEFLVTCSELMYMKSRLMLPLAIDEDEEELDPKIQLAQRLEEYVRYKEASQYLRGQFEERRGVFGRPATEEGPQITGGQLGDGTLFTFEDVGTLDLFLAMRRALERAPRGREIRKIEISQVTVQDRMREITERIRGVAEGVAFEDLVPDPTSRADIIVTFVALLELIKRRRAAVRQQRVFGEIRVLAASAVARN
jgi:segregation and condensation protein A